MYFRLALMMMPMMKAIRNSVQEPPKSRQKKAAGGSTAEVGDPHGVGIFPVDTPELFEELFTPALSVSHDVAFITLQTIYQLAHLSYLAQIDAAILDAFDTGGDVRFTIAERKEYPRGGNEGFAIVVAKTLTDLAHHQLHPVCGAAALQNDASGFQGQLAAFLQVDLIHP
jgi:hypothetical protein